MSSEPKPEDIKKAARNKAMQWYRRIENRVAPVVALSGLIIENTTRWAFEKRNQHYYTTYYQAKGFLTSPCQNLVGFLRAREIEALSSLWELSYEQPNYSNRKKFVFVRDPSDTNKGSWVYAPSNPPTVRETPAVTSTVIHNSVTDKE